MANWTTEPLSQSNDIGVRHEESASVSFDTNSNTATLISGGPLLMIPQELDKWEVGTSIKTADSKLQCYLEISCKVVWYGNVFGTPHYWIGNAKEYERIFMPFSATLQPGKKYQYTIIFGGGYDKDGEKNTTTFLD